MIIDKLTLKYEIPPHLFLTAVSFLNRNFKNRIKVLVKKNANSIFQVTAIIKENGNACSIFLAYGSLRNKSLKNTAFLKFNPSKASIFLINIIQNLHSFWKKNFFVHEFDLAWDLKVPVSMLFAYTNKRKRLNIHGTKYYGPRSSHGNIKIYDKKAEQLSKGTLIADTVLSRFEYTFKFVGKGVKPLDINVVTNFKKNNSLHDLRSLNMKDLNFLLDAIYKPAKKLSYLQRLLKKHLLEKTKLSLPISNKKIIFSICILLKDYKTIVKLICSQKESASSFLLSSYTVEATLHKNSIFIIQHRLPLLL